jgi:predicted small lipoprotein YifL
MSGRVAAGALLVALVLLAGCGKKGAPVAPGPADQIIYPRSYPDPARSLD